MPDPRQPNAAPYQMQIDLDDIERIVGRLYIREQMVSQKLAEAYAEMAELREIVRANINRGTKEE